MTVEVGTVLPQRTRSNIPSAATVSPHLLSLAFGGQLSRLRARSGMALNAHRAFIHYHATLRALGGEALGTPFSATIPPKKHQRTADRRSVVFYSLYSSISASTSSSLQLLSRSNLAASASKSVCSMRRMAAAQASVRSFSSLCMAAWPMQRKRSRE